MNASERLTAALLLILLAPNAHAETANSLEAPPTAQAKFELVPQRHSGGPCWSDLLVNGNGHCYGNIVAVAPSLSMYSQVATAIQLGFRASLGFDVSDYGEGRQAGRVVDRSRRFLTAEVIGRYQYKLGTGYWVEAGLGAIHHADKMTDLLKKDAENGVWGTIFSVTNGYEVEVHEQISVSGGLRLGVHLPITEAADGEVLPIVGGTLGVAMRF